MAKQKADPADKIKTEEKGLDDVKTFDVGGLTLSDFKAVPERRARMVHPFEGYPLKPKVEVGKSKVSATYIVAINPTMQPPQDPSGVNQTISNSRGQEVRRATILSAHSRIMPVGTNANEEIVFDREFKLADGNSVLVAVVPRHEHRARLMYYYDWKKERLMVDRRYLFLDGDQAGKLRQLFQMLINPKLKKERQAQMVAGEVEAGDAELGAIPEGA